MEMLPSGVQLKVYSLAFASMLSLIFPHIYIYAIITIIVPDKNGNLIKCPRHPFVANIAKTSRVAASLATR